MAHFESRGNPMKTVRMMENQNVLLARKTQQYASGPSVSFVIGYVVLDEVDDVRIQGTDPHQLPISKFQRWWPLPLITLTKDEKLADKRKK